MTTPRKRHWSNIHPKVSATVFAGACAALIIAILKRGLGIDLTGMEANLMVIISGIAGYWFPGE